MTRRNLGRFVAVLFTTFVFLTGGPAGAQVQWRPWSGLENRVGHSLTIDPAGGGLLLFGGYGGATTAALNDTWRWDGATWTRLEPLSSPPARTSHASAVDTNRQRVVLFGGHGAASVVDDTWEWDGVRWLERGAPSRPSAREAHAMAFDQRRGVTVLFGGADRPASGTFLRPIGGTWEWDGSRWIQRSPGTQPSARYGHAMVFDAARAQIVMFGGTGAGRLDDTWAWDGFNWRLRTPSTSPPARAGHAMVFDPVGNRVLLAGGRDHRLQYLDDLWAWDGTDWTLLTPPQALPARMYHEIAWDEARGGAVAFGGQSMLGRMSDTWFWDGGTWSLEATSAAPPEAPAHVAWDPVRRRVAVFVGTSGTPQPPNEQWEWDGRAWSQRFPPTMPAGRLGAGIATDTERGRVVLFGGVTNRPTSDTWEWDGADWSERTQAAPVPARSGHALAFDAARSRVVLFGGRPWTGAAFSDTWEWDGTSWVERFPTARPPGRSNFAMAFDAARARVLLFGGMVDGLGYASDTWEWDGAEWHEMLPATRPMGRSSHGMTYDAARRRVVLFGGFSFSGNANTYFSDTWEWDGRDWIERESPIEPSARYMAWLVHDPIRAVTVLFGGQKAVGGTTSDTWEYGPLHPARAEPFGGGCAGTAGIPTLSASPGAGPWLGEAFVLEIGDLPPAPIALVLVGASRTAFPPYSLPLDLGILGMPGCALRVSMETVTPVLCVGGRARWAIRVPPDPVALGATIHGQALVVDPGANRFGATLTNALTAVVGAK